MYELERISYYKALHPKTSTVFFFSVKSANIKKHIILMRIHSLLRSEYKKDNMHYVPKLTKCACNLHQNQLFS